MDCVYEVPVGSVVSDVIDGEAILLNLKAGSYYSSDRIGAVVWQAIVDGAARSQILDWARRCFPEATAAPEEICAFLDDLVSNRLIVPVDANVAVDVALPAPSIAYAAPRLEAHHDMQDLLLIDPIHEVEADIGWPTRKIDSETTLR